MYKDIIGILLSNDVYNELKFHENEIIELIPELRKCKGFNQNNSWHIFDVYEHILHVVSAVEPNIYLRLSALFHDIGKPLIYTEDSKGIGHFYNHSLKSLEIFINYKDKFGLSNDDYNLISYLIFYHDIDIEMLSDEEKDIMVGKIGIENIGYLFELKKAELLAQSSDYHYLLNSINDTKEKIIKYSK